MTVVSTSAPSPAVADSDTDRRSIITRDVGRWTFAIVGPLVVFGLLAALKGTSPISVYQEMITSILSVKSFGEILVKATPILLAALAVALPARAGLVNVGGEGQLVIGAVCAYGATMMLGSSVPGPVVIATMVLAAAIGGAMWSVIAIVLRIKVGINEAVTTLLMNYIAIDVMAFLVYDRWKDRKGSGQPVSRPLPTSERLGQIALDRVHLGLVFAVVALIAVWVTFRFTSFGFKLRVLGGNPEAARRAGLKVSWLLLIAMGIGGALAGIGGMTQLAGVEFKLRQGLVVQYGYIAYLASWLGRHRPMGLVGATLLLSALSIGGDSLQIDSGLPAASVNVLMALLLLGVFGWGRLRKQPDRATRPTRQTRLTSLRRTRRATS
jgi:general nucleoside transport system permease protein